MSSRMEISASRYRSLPRGFLPAEIKKLDTEPQVPSSNVQNSLNTSPPSNTSNTSENKAPVSSTGGLKIKGKKSAGIVQSQSSVSFVSSVSSLPPSSQMGRKNLNVQVSNKIKLSDTL